MNHTVNSSLKVISRIVKHQINTRPFYSLPVSRNKLHSYIQKKLSCISKTSTSSCLQFRNKSVVSKRNFQVEESAIKMNQTQLDSLQGMSKAYSVVEVDGWMQIGAYNVFAWTVSGVESCVVIKGNDIKIVFDMGIAIKESVIIPHVFITHGHTDHIGGVANHVAKRSLFGLKPASYYVPPHLVQPLQADMAAHYQMAETIEALDKVKILPITEGDTIRITSNYFMKSFPTLHRIPSQGYILYKEEKKLKEQYKGAEGFEVAALYRQGVEIHDVIVTPEIAYTGDTIFDVFTNPPTPDLLKVKLLITEATFLEREDPSGKSVVEKARSRGHIHLQEIIHNPHLFTDIGHILLVHFSNKYSSKYICDTLRDQIPQSLKHKVIPATVATATRPTTYSR